MRKIHIYEDVLDLAADALEQVADKGFTLLEETANCLRQHSIRGRYRRRVRAQEARRQAAKAAGRPFTERREVPPWKVITGDIDVRR